MQRAMGLGIGIVVPLWRTRSSSTASERMHPLDWNTANVGVITLPASRGRPHRQYKIVSLTKFYRIAGVDRMTMLWWGLPTKLHRLLVTSSFAYWVQNTKDTTESKTSLRRTRSRSTNFQTQLRLTLSRSAVLRSRSVPGRACSVSWPLSPSCLSPSFSTPQFALTEGKRICSAEIPHSRACTTKRCKNPNNLNMNTAWMEEIWRKSHVHYLHFGNFQGL